MSTENISNFILDKTTASFVVCTPECVGIEATPNDSGTIIKDVEKLKAARKKDYELGVFVSYYARARCAP